MDHEGRPGAGDGRPAGWPGQPVYLDYNATTPVDARVAQAARPYWDQWFGNPSSTHGYGERPRQAVTRQMNLASRAWPSRRAVCGSV